MTQGNGTMKEHRTRFWIDPFQTGLLVRIAIYLLVYQFAIWAFLTFCDRLSTTVEATGASWPFLASGYWRTALAFLLVVPPLAVDAIRFAHRLIGPLYRFRKTIEAVAAGEPVSLVHLRKGDLLIEFQDALNGMLRTLESKGVVVIEAPITSVSSKPAEATPQLQARPEGSS
jgi:hypothetical protein